MKVIDPVAVRRTPDGRPAVRPTALARLRVGLLHNGKPGGEHLLSRLATRLVADHGATLAGHWRKPHPSAGADFLDQVAARCDVVVGALSD